MRKVEIEGFAFKPRAFTVNRGTRVRFLNSDRAPHTATRAGSFDTRRIKPGDAAVVRFKRRGTFGYFCKIHPFMKGKVVVR